MAPMISNLGKSELEQFDKKYINEKNKLLKIRNFVEENFEYVGKNFSKKVREIYYDKNNNKTIYGTTTPEERNELAEEGIELVTIPWVNKDN